MSWTICKEFTFEASHQLLNHDGKCARLHGHSWKGRVYVKSSNLHTFGPKAGMVIDFGDLKAMLKPIIEEFLDHRHLNDTVDPVCPTSEMVALWLYQKVKESHDGVVAVEIDETCTSSCRYQED